MCAERASYRKPEAKKAGLMHAFVCNNNKLLWCLTDGSFLIQQQPLAFYLLFNAVGR
jgi:hypothetical protein